MSFTPIEIEKFKPAVVADQTMPALIWADVSKLQVDHRYQRTISGPGRRAIQRIADTFDWKKYQPIIVAPAEGGMFSVVDGQHRAHAAKVCGLKSIPAMTVAMTLSEQAAGFAAINRDRIAIDNCAIFRAELAAGAEWAVTCDQIVSASGCTLARSNASTRHKKPGTIYAIKLIRRMVENGEGEAVTAGLAGLFNSECGEDTEIYKGNLLSLWLPAVAVNQRFLRLDLSEAVDSYDIATELEDARARERQGGPNARATVLAGIVDHLRGML
ncbi:ParB N-terminal domain-containing protein [Thalassobius sp. I31.1]|uniref:ParB N-terminal domain-containing protein n=1 Tax=Thalassobius sp. I31.1 TaxID=2109912 RepID=UPI000D1A16E9|nr:ParB N-terminal domain-containing protein [Thalassobius sp. I31.1]